MGRWNVNCNLFSPSGLPAEHVISLYYATVLSIFKRLLVSKNYLRIYLTDLYQILRFGIELLVEKNNLIFF